MSETASALVTSALLALAHYSGLDIFVFFSQRLDQACLMLARDHLEMNVIRGE